ncbi:MAG: DUF512 domain-containing protein [Clostridia bacterium]|nr:DUF512 domain-containing protein [Clostridia bacterium]
MSVRISGVERHSPAAFHFIKPGDALISINGNEIRDVLDYRFYIDDDVLDVKIKKPNGKLRSLKIKTNGRELGLTFDTYLMDKQRSCANNCIFCFIDQLPKGLRESLYFKDDDSRLSFLFGNYITLTNIGQKDVDRIIKMHISPVNISVHTTNPELRVKMMGNNRAGKVLEYIDQLAKAGIKMNTQLVLCPGYNDGEELSKTLEDLGGLYPSVQSIACVPVGLTCCRDGLTPLAPFTCEQAKDVLSRINIYNDRFLCYNKTNIAYAADEFYIKAGEPMPDAERYGEFMQLENGVGLWTLLKTEVLQELENYRYHGRKRKATVATGVAAYPLIKELCDRITEKSDGLEINVVEVKNRLFGDMITVAGLICGNDFYEALKDVDLGEELLIPFVSLRREGDMFLDDVTLKDLSERLNIKITPVLNDGKDFTDKISGKG